MDTQDVSKVVAGRTSASPVGLPKDVVSMRSGETDTPIGIRSSPPVISRPETMDIDTDILNEANDNVDAGNKSDSEAETIVLPGKDGHSPSKVRKMIKHEDKSDDEDAKNAPNMGSIQTKIGRELVPQSRSQLGETSTVATSTSSLGKRKRQKTANVKDDPAHLGNSSGLSSVPTSPVATTRSSLSKPAASDSDVSRSPSPRARSTTRVEIKSTDRAYSRRTFASQSGEHSGDDEDTERARFVRQRSSGTETRYHRDNRSSSKFRPDGHSRKRTRSISPPSRIHRRSASTQVATKSSHGLSHKKKRVPAPLQSTEYHSDDSSASDRSHPRSSRLRSLAAPVTGGSTMSPVKIAPHKKHVNSSGQTFLARACLSGKLEVAKQRYEERPQDLNEPDHALNTPLHVASINGYEDVVKFLLDKNCIVDVVNDQKDTPLHDAIENGHVEVVKLLFEAGADPNKPNRHGDEPLDLVNEKEESGAYDESEASEIRAAILEAKQNNRDVRRVSEDELSNLRDGARQSPSVPTYDSHTLNATGRRVGTARSQKTSDHLLYQPLTATELQKAAKEGDASAAARVLEVHTNLNDPKSLTLAAKGGHLDVLNILFAMGGFDPDPPLAEGVSLEQATPMLAAIGRDAHLKVIELILGQDNFNPTRRIKGQTYFEIAKERAGPKWQEEEKLFKEAYERYEKTHKSSPRKPRSPGLRRDGRDIVRDARKAHKVDESQTARSHKRSMSSPKTKEYDSKSSVRNSGLNKQSKDGQVRRGPGRPRKEESSAPAVTSDPESLPLGPPKPKALVKRSDSEAGIMSDTEAAAKPRRKLVSGKELRGERELEKQRRTSVASNASSASVKEKRVLADNKGEKLDERLSPGLSRLVKKVTSGQIDPDIVEKHPSDKDRARSIMRDESKDRLTAIRSESPVKRHRKSETPPRSATQDAATGYSASGGPLKRRKLEGEAANDTRSDSTPASSPDVRTSTARSPLPGHDDGNERRSLHSKIKQPQAVKTHSTSEETTKASKSETSTTNRSSKPSSHRPTVSQELESKKVKPGVEDQSNRSDRESEREKEREKEKQRATKRKEEAAAREAEAKREEERAREAEAEALREKEREIARQKKLKEALELERVEKANIARVAREEAAREEDAKRQAEEAERKETQRIQDAEAAARETERQRILYVEQQKLKHEEQERRRALQVEQQRAERARIAEEERVQRLSRLPLLLRWFDLLENPKNRDVASLFRWVDGYRFDTIRSEATGLPSGREQWMLNINAAILLGEKDLHLTRYTAWERVPLTIEAKKAVWRANNGAYTLREPSLAVFRKQLLEPGISVDEVMTANRSLFLGLDLFFVKVSEFMFIVPNFPHLRNVEMLVNYKELDITCKMPPPPPKWKQDPDVDPNQKFTPQPKLYISGQLVKQQDAPLTKITREPPSNERWAPRRELVTVYPSDSDYEMLCRKQGLTHLIQENQVSPSSEQSPSTVQPNGHISLHEEVNGITPPSSIRTKSVNGGSPPRESVSDTAINLTNGTHDSSVSPTSTVPPTLS